MYHRIGSRAYKEGLENIEALAALTGHPEKKWASVHVAGTNGKGSVAHLFASFFQEKGYKTGLYTSPHLVHFNERVKINGIPISEDAVLHFFKKYEHVWISKEIAPSFFEMTTILAFDYFARQNVDIAVIETGLGGRLDSTNIITPLLSVITHISLDHVSLLGNTLSDIAREKAGIIKQGVPVVIGKYQSETWQIFNDIARKQGAPLYLADALDGEMKNLLPGNFQQENIATFVKGLEVLSSRYSHTKEDIKKSIINIYKNTHLQGRWQILRNNPLVICDVGHNAGAFEWITAQLATMSYTHLHFVFGVVNDKDLDTIIPLLPRDRVTYYLCRADIERALSPEILSGRMQAYHLHTTLSGSVAHACQQALQEAGTGEMVFIGGSCFVVGEALIACSHGLI